MATATQWQERKALADLKTRSTSRGTVRFVPAPPVAMVPNPRRFSDPFAAPMVPASMVPVQAGDTLIVSSDAPITSVSDNISTEFVRLPKPHVLDWQRLKHQRDAQRRAAGR